MQKDVLIPREKGPILKFKTPKASPYGDHESIVGGKLKLSNRVLKFDEDNRVPSSFQSSFKEKKSVPSIS